MKLLSVAQIRSLENQAAENGLSYREMMQNAASGLADVIEARFHHLKADLPVIGLIGPGNNGGDTLVALRILRDLGWKTKAVLFFRNKTDDFPREEYVSTGGDFTIYEEGSGITDLPVRAIVLDGLLGTGTTLPTRPRMRAVLEQVSQHFSTELTIRIAVDCPSGMDCDSGETDCAVLPANLTVCMAGVKQGLVLPQALQFVGELIDVPIGLDQTLKGWAEALPHVISEKDVRNVLGKRKPDGHKGTFGSVCVIGGMTRYPGAPVLAGMGAYRVGCGLVQLAVPAGLITALPSGFLEAVWLPLDEIDGSIAESATGQVLNSSQRYSSFVLGPGIGLTSTAGDFIEALFRLYGETAAKMKEPEKKPVWLIDADGLKALDHIEAWWKFIPERSILTPHPGEMSILTRLPIDEIQNNRLQICSRFAREWGHVVVLKGAGTVIGHPDGRLGLIPVATSALAHAGTGDVLAGIIGGLTAQGIPAYEACIAGCWLHAQAGLVAARKIGSPASVMAGDVLDAIGEVLGKFWSQ